CVLTLKALTSRTGKGPYRLFRRLLESRTRRRRLALRSGPVTCRGLSRLACRLFALCGSLAGLPLALTLLALALVTLSLLPLSRLAVGRLRLRLAWTLLARSGSRLPRHGLYRNPRTYFLEAFHNDD